MKRSPLNQLISTHGKFQVEYWTPTHRGTIEVWSSSAKEAVACALRMLKSPDNPTLEGCGAKVRKPDKSDGVK
jgi:hypothetical protein